MLSLIDLVLEVTWHLVKHACQGKTLRRPIFDLVIYAVTHTDVYGGYDMSFDHTSLACPLSSF